MRTIPLTLAAAALAGALNAQTTGLDFTANDCGGTPHQLFAELDSGYTVVLDLVMLNGCQPCIDASHAITDDVLPNTSDPARVRFYSIGYTNAITCTAMTNWQNQNGFAHPVFAGMSAQTTYYGGMGMPTIIVLGGGSAHSVCYLKMGYNASDAPVMVQALNDCLAASIGINEPAAMQVTVGPNPADDVLTVDGPRWTGAAVTDMQGRTVRRAAPLGGRIDVGGLPPGMYVLRLTDVSGATGTARFEKR